MTAHHIDWSGLSDDDIFARILGGCEPCVRGGVTEMQRRVHERRRYCSTA